MSYVSFVRAPIAIATVVGALVLGADRAKADDCPAVAIELAASGVLDGDFTSGKPLSGTADAVLYAGDASYTASLTVTSEKARAEVFRSKIFLIEPPAGIVFEGMAVSFTAADGTHVCDRKIVLPVKHSATASGDDLERRASLDAQDRPIVPVPGVRQAALACATPYRDATLEQAAQLPYPAIARKRGMAGDVEIRIDLDTNGAVANATVFRSSGFEPLDRSALDSARGSIYKPAIFRCEPVTGSFLFRADFTTR